VFKVSDRVKPQNFQSFPTVSKNVKADSENKTKRTRTNNKQNNKKQDSTAGGQLISS